MPDLKEPRKGKGKIEYRQLGLLGTIPIIMVVGPVVGFFIGKWLDSKLGTAPFLLILFLVFGFIASGKETYRIIKRAEERPDDDKHEN
jgi:F0F1-type ATP synthase assembly protein I